MSDIKAGDYVIMTVEWRLSSRKVYRKVTKVTRTDVYVETRLYPTGTRFERQHFEKYWRKATKLELLLDGVE